LYLDFLRVSELREEWQIRQAGDAIRLYIDHFLDGDRTIFATVKGPTSAVLDDLKSDAMKRMRQTLRIRNYAYRTEKTYLDWVNRYFSYCKSVNAPVTGRDASDSRFVKAYISHLALERDVAASTQNQAFNALLFFYRKVFEIDLQGLGDTVRARRGAKLPVVLSVEEIERLFLELNGTSGLMLKLIYGAGLRLMELARLRVKDVDFQNNVLLVRTAKGDKARATLLPDSIRESLSAHLQRVRKLHENDLNIGRGEVFLPNALYRKYPNMAKEWGWQYVFPARGLSVDPRSGKVRRYHSSEKLIRRLR
jgi:integron integrase